MSLPGLTEQLRQSDRNVNFVSFTMCYRCGEKEGRTRKGDENPAGSSIVGDYVMHPGIVVGFVVGLR